MKTSNMRWVVIMGFVVIAGVLTLQGLWLRKAIVSEQDRLDEDIHIALLEVVKELYRDQPLPQNNPVKRVSADYYAVNTEAEIDAKLLEYFLKVELSRRQVNLDFEYAIYNCEDDQMAYGRYVTQDGSEELEDSYFPKLDEYVYYFAVRFPERGRFIASSLSEWIILTVLMILFLAIYSYAVLAFIRQRRFSEMQKDFINTMAHEFKTPLSSIQLAAGYLSDFPAIRDDERASKYAEALASSSHRLNSEVERILELGKVESNRMPLDIQTVPFQATVEEIWHALEVNYANVSCQFVASDLTSIQADETHFRNVMYNLLDNAAKYGATEVYVESEKRGSGGKIWISDNGPGISEADQKLVFKKFYRSVGGKTIKGFGLGLYYVKQVVEAHGWQIRFIPARRGGVTLEITIQDEG